MEHAGSDSHFGSVAFFTPTDRFNERYEELNNHPDWSFYGGDFPSNAELIAARKSHDGPASQDAVRGVALRQLLGRPAERCREPGPLSQHVRRYAARIGELGRQPFTARRFFDKYQDRILFATDATPHGDEFPPASFSTTNCTRFYYRFLETEDEYFDYAPAKIPPQGRWRIYGINLPDAVLRSYHENAARLLRSRWERSGKSLFLDCLSPPWRCRRKWRAARHPHASDVRRGDARSQPLPSTSSPPIASTIPTPYAILNKPPSRPCMRAIYLENEYLKCSVLPDIGGHLYTCLDKISGKSMFYANPSIKKGSHRYRGAWPLSESSSTFRSRITGSRCRRQFCLCEA